MEMGHRELLQRTAHTEAVRPSTDNAPQGMMVPAAGFAKDGKVHPRLVSLAHIRRVLQSEANKVGRWIRFHWEEITP
jgi:hypothetical protein